LPFCFEFHQVVTQLQALEWIGDKMRMSSRSASNSSEVSAYQQALHTYFHNRGRNEGKLVASKYHTDDSTKN